jgi:activator of HSP90 ATPase
MSKTINQVVKFPGSSAKELYNLYMNAKKHAEVTGEPVELSKKAGEKFSAYGKQLRGKNLQVSANKQVVQTWRAKGWDRKAPDSILILRFVDTEGGAEVHMTHAFVPDEVAKDIKKGWNDHYWKKWKSYIKVSGVPVV